MRQFIPALLAACPIVIASQSVFSVHDDILAYPQYEVIFSDSFLSDTEANILIHRPKSSIHNPTPPDTKSIESHQHPLQDPLTKNDVDPSSQTHELMWLHGDRYFCTIPIVTLPPRNETSEAEARAAEQKELARATDRGWQLLQDLEGDCLYFVSGWWSYSFCYNNAITQFHSLPPQPGKPPFPPQPDPSAQEFVLGKATTTKSKEREDEWGNQIEAKKAPRAGEPPKTELQVKGDTRYLVQKMEDGTVCDLTGKPRQVEVQFHCNPHVTDRIGYIKEITTCSYLMVVYTPRLCSDVAFLPPKENKSHSITCQPVIPEDQIPHRSVLKSLEAEFDAAATEAVKKPIVIGGITVGAGHFIGKEGQRMPVPESFGSQNQATTEVIARAKSQAEGGEVEVLSDAKLVKMDLDPKMIEELRKEMQELAKEKGWKIEVVDAPGQIRDILGIVEGDDDKKSEGPLDPPGEGEEESEEGSEEIFKDEL
ncbi:hypothetical protein CJF32_00002796 [Rutstroemia sp. NJR-2017a WRK4]|nr:hypothetical protein CJF32_00002796 [Rutstroemia sp. NJR-2017a WRK4]